MSYNILQLHSVCEVFFKFDNTILQKIDVNTKNWNKKNNKIDAGTFTKKTDRKQLFHIHVLLMSLTTSKKKTIDRESYCDIRLLTIHWVDSKMRGYTIETEERKSLVINFLSIFFIYFLFSSPNSA